MESKRILFFDDEPFITKMLINNLQVNFGWNKENLGEITFVSTPEELFDKVYGAILYDLFVLDIMVPIDQTEKMTLFSKEELDRMQLGDNTGIVFAEKIRSIDKYRNVPILFLSARMESSKPMTNSAYLEKPRFASEISDILKNILNVDKN